MALTLSALTTVATVAAELGLTADAGSPLERDLQRRINLASDAIEKYCGRRFGRAAVAEKLAGFGTPYLLLTRVPVLSVTSVKLDDQLVDAGTYELEKPDAGMLRHLQGCWEWTADWAAGAAGASLAGSERPRYEVAYEGGFVLPRDDSGATPRTLPYDVEEACVLAVVASYRAKGRDPAIVAESAGNASVTYAGSTVNTGIGRGLGGVLPDSAAMMLLPYRRWR